MTSSKQESPWVARGLTLAAEWRRTGDEADYLRLWAHLREILVEQKAVRAAYGRLVDATLVHAEDELRRLAGALLGEEISVTELELLAEQVSGTPASDTAAVTKAANRRGFDDATPGHSAEMLLEKLLSQLQLASEMPEMKQLDERLLNELRAFFANQAGSSDDGSVDGLVDRNRRLEAELMRARELSLTDEGTELPNRRAFMQALSTEVGRAARDAVVFCVALIDLDDFKSMNDAYGHAAGDEVLRRYAAAVLGCFRAQDTVARYGGEEFAVLLPGTAMDGARKALGKMRERVRRERFAWQGTAIALPTFSCGIVQFEPGEDLQRLIDRADRLMYEAKRLGKDRIEVDTTPHMWAVGNSSGRPEPGELR